MYKRVISLFVTGLLLLTAVSVQAAQESGRFVQAYQFGETTVSFDLAYPEVPEEILLRSVDAHSIQWTKEQLSQLFPHIPMNTVENVKGYLEYMGEDGTYLACDPDGFITYQSGVISNTRAVRLYSDACEGRNDGGTLPGYSFEEAYNQVARFIQQTGAGDFMVSRYSAMDTQALMGESTSAEGVPDEGYLMYLQFLFDGQTVMDMPPYVNAMGDFTYGSAVVVYVTQAGGVLMFYCVPTCTLFLADGAVEVSQQAPITLEEAAQALGQHYGMMLGANSMEFDRVTYEYVPLRQKNRRFTLTSAWCFYSADQTAVMPVNAATGQVIR